MKIKHRKQFNAGRKSLKSNYGQLEEANRTTVKNDERKENKETLPAPGEDQTQQTNIQDKNDSK